MRKVQRAPADLLYTKLTPPRPQTTLVTRDALLARLDAGLPRALTLIAAPAGFGKTTLVSEWIATRREPNAWVSLDGEDDDPVRFWRYVITACQAVEGGLGRSALMSLRAAQPPSFQALLTPFINELTRLPDRAILVLDDYHFIASPEIHGALSFLLEHSPATLHVIVITRGEPPLPIARLRARHQLNELGAADLRFSSAEIQAFFQQALHLPLATPALARLEAQTEGWATGLRLISLALEGRADQSGAEEFLAAFTGRDRHIVDYLVAEVLADQPQALQDFLLPTSLLDRLTGSLCEAVTGRSDSAEVLEQLARANLFLIPLGGDGRRTWYRYHALFAEAMRQVARQRLGEAQVRTLTEKAGRWYEEHGLLDEAIEAALVAQDLARAAALIEQVIEQRSFNELRTLRRWVEQMPEEVLRAHPALSFNYAMMLLYTLDRYAPATAARLEPPLRLAEEAWRSEQNEARLGQVLSLRANVNLWQGDLTRGFAYAREALELLPEDDTLWRGASLLTVSLEELMTGQIDAAQQRLIESRALCGAAQNSHGVLAATGLLGQAGYWQGEFDQASQLYQQVLADAIGGEEMLDDQALAWLGLGAIAYERNDLSAAEQHALRARDLAVQRSNEDVQVHATLLLARVKQARGEMAQAQALLHALAAHIHRPLLLREVLLWQARLSLANHELAAVEHWVEAQVQVNPNVPLTQQEQEELLSARWHIANHQPAAALKLLDVWRGDAHQAGRVRSEIETLCVQALAYAEQADEARAAKALTRALTIAQPKGYRRIFLDEGDPLAHLLQTVAPDWGKRPIATYAIILLRAFASTRSAQLASTISSPLLEPLSPQEQRVLRLLAAGLSNPEIARELVVSTNTIKTQVQSIYRKLNVNSRDEAARMAHQLNLL